MLTAAPGDIRPDNWFSFTEGAGYEGIDPIIAASFQGFSPATFGFAPGEEIGIWPIPSISMGTFPSAPQSGGPAATGTFIPSIFESVLSGWWDPTPPLGPVRPTVGYSPVPTWEGGTTDEEMDEMWSQVYAQYEVLNPEGADDVPDPYEPSEEQPPMSSFWDIASGVVDVIQGQQVGGSTIQGSAYGLAPPVAAPGTDMYIQSATGRPISLAGKGCRRRRRRRLLTESDYNDLMRISTLPNKEGVRIALAKAIGRSR